MLGGTGSWWCGGPATNSDFSPECGSLAVFNGRADVGVHAGELTRTFAWLSSLPYVSRLGGLLSANHVTQRDSNSEPLVTAHCPGAGD